jgi:hypothetical protein
VLKIELLQQWREGLLHEFVVKDHATTLHPVREDSFREDLLMRGASYAQDFREGLPVLRRLRPDAVRRKLADGVYFDPPVRDYRTQIPLLDARNEDSLRRCRSYYLHWFLIDLVEYFNGIGLPFQLKLVPFQKVSKSSVAFMQPQLSLQGSTVALIDDRLRPSVRPDLEPSDFADQLFQRIKNAYAREDWTPSLVPTPTTALQPGDLVLRLQDNLGEDFYQPNEEQAKAGKKPGVLAGHKDPYKQFQLAFGTTISQSLNINTHTHADDMDADDLNEDDEGDDTTSETNTEESEYQTLDSYFTYKLPPRKWIELRVLNSLNQLGLKLMVRSPGDACRRFPVLERLHETIFLYKHALVYRDKDALVFLQTPSNETAIQVIKERTGWNIFKDILLPAQRRISYKKVEEPDEEKLHDLLRQGRFMVSPQFVWQIEDCDERVLYDIPEIQRRMRARDSVRPKRDFYPTYTTNELAIFDRQTLEAFAQFLDTTVREQALSYAELRRYKDQGLYTVLGIQKGNKLQDYLRVKQLFRGSVKGTDVIPAYTGISYLPDTRQYYVGDKYGLDEGYRQERGFMLRRIIVHQNRNEQTSLDEQLMEYFFPLLEVNFIRYRRYTVYPFPFKLIEIWNGI